MIIRRCGGGSVIHRLTDELTKFRQRFPFSLWSNLVGFGKVLGPNRTLHAGSPSLVRARADDSSGFVVVGDGKWGADNGVLGLCN